MILTDIDKALICRSVIYSIRNGLLFPKIVVIDFARVPFGPIFLAIILIMAKELFFLCIY